MNWFVDLITNPFLIAGTSSWLIAQVIKTILYAIVNKEWDIHRLHGDGGMPSGHSATVTSLATMSALLCGLGSFQFAVTAILAIVVCHDATGVRRETGKQAMVINELRRTIQILSSEELPEVKLKELVGHTPLQVFAGMLVGVVNALLLHVFWL